MFDNPDLNKIRRAVADLRKMGINPTNFCVTHETAAKLDSLGIVANEIINVTGMDQGVGKEWERTLCGVPLRLMKGD